MSREFLPAPLLRLAISSYLVICICTNPASQHTHNKTKNFFFSRISDVIFGQKSASKNALNGCGRSWDGNSKMTSRYHLVCGRDESSMQDWIKQKEGGFSATLDIRYHNHSLKCPCAIDKFGRCRQQQHMCETTARDFICDIRIRNVLITSSGAIIDCATLSTISFEHPTMSKGAYIYFEGTHNKWQQYFLEKAAKEALSLGPFRLSERAKSMPVYDIVVPTRMLWDGKFTHLSFQALPLIALVKELYGSLWDKLTWHASTPTAALLVLLDVPRERIVVGKDIYARQLLLPWAPYWCPPKVSLWRGITKSVAREATQRLLSSHYFYCANCGKEIKRRRREIIRGNSNSNTRDYELSVGQQEQPGQRKSVGIPVPRSEIVHINASKKLVVYLSRPRLPALSRFQFREDSPRGPTRTHSYSRFVVNEEEILEAIRTNLRPEYELAVIAGYASEYNSIEALHMSWAKYAHVLSHARVVIGPHGGAFNNLIWTPEEDVDYVEFNEYPDDLTSRDSHAGVPVRTVFLSAAWEKGGSGRFYIVPATIKDPVNFYSGHMRVSPRDVMMVFMQIGGVLRADFSIDRYPEEVPNRVWNRTAMYGKKAGRKGG